MSNALIDEAQRQAQARNEFEARQDAAAALGGVFQVGRISRACVP